MPRKPSKGNHGGSSSSGASQSVLNTQTSEKDEKEPAGKRRKREKPSPGQLVSKEQNSGGDKAEKTGRAVDFPVVALGASAGGLEALQAFLGAVGDGMGVAFVVLLHEDPYHESQLCGLLQEHTGFKVSQISDSDRPRLRQVHVCPPGRLLGFAKGRFQVKERRGKGALATVDYLFHSMALEMETRCAAVVLSGTGSDGARGVLDVKMAGGLVMVQDEDTAAYNGMPRAARSTGAADFVLPPEEMPTALMRYFGDAKRLEDDSPKGEIRFKEVAAKIFFQVKQQTGHDFSHYKTSTMRRRVERRMSLHHLSDFHDYVDFLRKNRGEVEELFQEFLIGVTAFFRDPKAWEALKAKVLMPRLKDMEHGDNYRIWAPGCASGEEVYSAAILIWECMEELDLDLGLQIFGTDVDPKAIVRAREGRFPQSVAGDFGPERLKRFFYEESGHYVVRKELRENMVFSEQDVMRDPPFSRLDLLVCRNLLIYLTPEAQQRLLPLFHYTLRPGGMLFLGTSESVGRYTNLFASVDNKWKIFRKQQVAASVRPELYFPTGRHAFEGRLQTAASSQTVTAGGRLMADESKTPLKGLTERTKEALLQRFAPPAVVVDSRGNINYVHGRTGKYLEPAPGLSTLNLFSMARDNLSSQAALLLRQAAEKMQTQRAEKLEMRTNGKTQFLDLVVEPLDSQQEDPRFLVVFQEVEQPKAPDRQLGEQHEDGAETAIIKQLERELQNTRESHQSTMEELESSNEELKSANEEMQSTNEELQSTNEELESSREELQSMNEELSTVNSELRSKVDELDITQNDMANLLNATQIASLFLDSRCNIRRFTQEAAKIISLRDTDVGRPLKELTTKLEYDELARDAQQVMESLAPLEREMRTKEGAWYRVRLMPYRALENKIDGAVITFVDITELKEAQARALVQQRFAESVVDTVREPLLVLNQNLEVISANRTFYLFFQTVPQETESRKIYDLGNGQWDNPHLRKLLEEIIPEKASFDEYVVEHEFPRIGHKRMLLNARRMEESQAGDGRILLAMLEERRSGKEGEN